MPPSDMLASGSYYTFEARVVRAGMPFGSSRAMLRYSKTTAERDASIAQYLHHARRRVVQRLRVQGECELRAVRRAKNEAAARKRAETLAFRKESAALVAAALIARLRSSAASG